jgi:CobQ-like glutamine amidotransferase family enzyme
VGELAADPLDVPMPPGGEAAPGVRLDRLTGFENHAGVTTLGAATHPFGRVVAGVGNGPGTGTDGARSGRIIGTYMHGPVLARNPKLADMLLALATGETPTPLDDAEERALHSERLSRLSGDGAGASTPAAMWRRLVRVRVR